MRRPLNLHLLPLSFRPRASPVNESSHTPPSPSDSWSFHSQTPIKPSRERGAYRRTHAAQCRIIRSDCSLMASLRSGQWEPLVEAFIHGHSEGMLIHPLSLCAKVEMLLPLSPSPTLRTHEYTLTMTLARFALHHTLWPVQ